MLAPDIVLFVVALHGESDRLEQYMVCIRETNPSCFSDWIAPHAL
jgi:hypothetical protein